MPSSRYDSDSHYRQRHRSESLSSMPHHSGVFPGGFVQPGSIAITYDPNTGVPMVPVLLPTPDGRTGTFYAPLATQSSMQFSQGVAPMLIPAHQMQSSMAAAQEQNSSQHGHGAQLAHQQTQPATYANTGYPQGQVFTHSTAPTLGMMTNLQQQNYQDPQQYQQQMANPSGTSTYFYQPTHGAYSRDV